MSHASKGRGNRGEIHGQRGKEGEGNRDRCREIMVELRKQGERWGLKGIGKVNEMVRGINGRGKRRMEKIKEKEDNGKEDRGEGRGQG